MYPHGKPCRSTGQKCSVAFGPLRTFALSVELRASPRDPVLELYKNRME